MEYIFTLKYQLSGVDNDSDVLIERLGAAGCDDAVVGIGQVGRLALEFTREAKSAHAAMRSALADVRRAIPTGALVEAAPDFVGLTDVAEIVGVSRQNMRKLMLAYPNDFPAPIHEGSTSIWHLIEVLEWLNTKGGYTIDQALLDVASVTLEVNLAKEMERLPQKAANSLRTFIA